MGLYVDIAALVLLIAFVVSGYLRGIADITQRGVAFALVTVGILVLSPLVVGLFCNNESIYAVISGWIPLPDVAKNIAVRIVLYLIAAVLISIVMLVCAKILTGAFEPESPTVAGRIIGAVVSLLFYGMLILFLIGILNTVNAEWINNLLSGSYVCKYNFLNGFCNTYLNLGTLIGLGK